MILDRTCIKCATTFVLKATHKSSNICYKCKRDYQREYERKKVAEIPEEERYKELYPMSDNQKRAKFGRIKKDLEKITNRGEWIEYMRNVLDTLDPKVLIWVYDRRDKESLNEERNSKRTIESYEDTRTTHTNKSWFD